MIGYIILTIILITLLLIYNKKNKNIILFSSSIFLIFFIGFRDFSVGNDTIAYIRFYESFGNLSFKDLIFNAPHNVEVGYRVYSWILYKISTHGLFLLLISSIITIGLISFWIKKNSNSYMFSFIILTALFIPFLMTGLRQGIAISILLYGSLKLQEKKYIRFMLITLLAFTFHKTALIGLIFIPVVLFRKIKIKHLVVYLISLILMIQFRIEIYEFSKNVFGYSHYDSVDGSSPLMYSILLFSLTIFIYVVDFLTKEERKNDKYYFMRNIFLLAMLIIPLVALNGSMMRIVMYFSIFIVILLPNVVQLFSSLFVEKKAIYNFSIFLMVTILLTLFLRNMYLSDTYIYRIFGG